MEKRFKNLKIITGNSNPELAKEICDYIGIVGTRRPCEGGEKCNVYEKRGKNYKPPKENLDYLLAK